MVRGTLALAAALALICLPVKGGGSGASVVRRSSGELDRPESRRTAPATTAGGEARRARPRIAPAPAFEPRFPQFLKPLPGEPPEPATAGRRRVRELLLSFDDGPDVDGTPLVLAELERRGLKAVFFVAGHHAIGARPKDLARRELIRTAAAAGHLVANHTLNHVNLCRDRGAIAAEVDGNAELITYATGVRPLLFRAPYGARCPTLDRALRERDLVQVGWNIDPQEWRGERAEDVLRYVVRKLRRLEGPGILLLHDTQPAAVRALPLILDWIDLENRRVAAEGGAPIRIVDYSVFLPEREVPPTGLEPLASALGGALSVVAGAAAGRDGPAAAE